MHDGRPRCASIEPHQPLVDFSPIHPSVQGQSPTSIVAARSPIQQTADRRVARPMLRN
jgi:hypothetical protein